MKPGYVILDHPADMGIEAYGKNLNEAFEEAAVALTSIILDASSIKPIEIQTIEITASDYEHLLVKWLSEILYLYDGKKFVCAEFDIENITPIFLRAKVKGENFDNNKHLTKLDVKAITYHQVLVHENGGKGLVRVFVDI